MAYSGKTADNKNTLIESGAWSPKAPTLKPTYPGPQGTGVSGDNLQKRTSSPAAENEKLYEPVSGGPEKTSK